MNTKDSGGADIEREIELMRRHAYDPGEKAMRKLRDAMPPEKVLRVLRVYAKLHREEMGESVH